MGWRYRSLVRLGPSLSLVAWLLLAGAPASAQDDSALLQMLSGSPSFRVRARAALALAHHGGERVVLGLEAALGDAHVAVRFAAAAALAEVGMRRSVPALREAAADREAIVAEQAKRALHAIAAREAIARAAGSAPEALPDRTPPRAGRAASSLAHVRYAVVLGEMRNRSGRFGPELSAALADEIERELRAVEHVAVFTLSEMNDQIVQELTRRKVPAFRLEGTLSRVESVRQDGDYRTRCEVSLLLMDEPERTLRGLLRGAATSSEQPRGDGEAQQRLLARKTLKSAVHSALSNAADAIEAAATRRDLGMGDLRAEASLGAP